VSIKDAVAAYLRARRAEGYSPATLRQYAYQLGRYSNRLGDRQVEAITLQELRDFVASHLKAQSLGHVVRTLRGFFRWLFEEEIIGRNPSVKLKEPKVPKAVPKALTFEELELLRDSCSTPLEHAIIEFLFATSVHARRMSTWHMRSIVKAVAMRCGLSKKVTPHVMRHTLATTLLNQGADLVAVQSILGHDKPETTQRYAHLSGARRQEEYARWFPQ